MSNYRLLEDTIKLQTLQEAATKLWPETPNQIAGMEAWLRIVREWDERRAVYRLVANNLRQTDPEKSQFYSAR